MKKMKTTKILSLLAAVVFLSSGVQYVLATSAQSASGWAWGGTQGPTGAADAYQGMGWISFNDITTGSGGGSYGVDIPASDGALSGYAWSDIYGWISFNGADLAGCVPALDQATRSGNNITGGARILSIRDAGANAGGFDGCMSLSGAATNGNPYGVTISAGNTVEGYAWSSDLGYINFGGGGGGGVSINPLVASDLAPQNMIISAAPYTVGAPINLTATFANNGTVDTPSGFDNNFSYSTDGGASWTEITSFPHGPLAAGDTGSDSGTYTPTAAGNLLLQHCVDSNMVNVYGEINEGALEVNNCQQLPVIMVTALTPVTMTVASCSIPVGADECTTAETTWTFNDTTPLYSIVNDSTGVTIGTTVSGTNVPTTLQHGPNNIEAYNNTNNLVGSYTVTPGCVASAEWSSITSLCEPTPVPTVTPAQGLILYDDSTTVSITNTSANPLTCDIYGATVAPHMGENILPGVTFTLLTKNIKAKQQVLVECVDGTTGLTSTNTFYIEVLPKIQEV
jgi:hypothetical protein